MRHVVMFVPILFIMLLLDNVHLTTAAEPDFSRPGHDSLATAVDVDAWPRNDTRLSSWYVQGGPAGFARFRNSRVDESSGGAEAPAENGGETPSTLPRDWQGLRRDTAFFLGYQVLAAGVWFLTPESVSKWTPEQRKTSLQQWWDNVRHPQWDPDTWYVNYLGHPYFGAIAYVRARERQFGAFGGFWYAALISGLYEFGIEALFEPPSYQDLIVTPVGGLLIGALLFDPIRQYIRGKPQLRWYDHLTLAATDPLGTTNHLIERSFGLETETQIQFRPPGLGTSAAFSEPSVGALSRPREQHHQYFGIAITFGF